MRSTYVIKDDQRSVDTSDGVVADTRLDGGHPGVDEFGRHDCGSSRTAGYYQEEDNKRMVKQAKSEAQNRSCSWSKQASSGQVVDSYGTASSRPGGGARDTHLIYSSGNGTE